MHVSRMAKSPSAPASAGVARRYCPPEVTHDIPLSTLLKRIGRPELGRRQLQLLQSTDGEAQREVTIFYSGFLDALEAPAVSIVGTRDVSEEGRVRASRLARELVQAGVTVVSGLAKGVDAAAHLGAIQARGTTVAVIGTPLTTAYPAENSSLQEEIYRNHLLLSPFGPSDRVFKGNFPARNKVMAAVSDATVIVEASDTSGTLHQAAECLKLDRWLFIMRSVVEDGSITWPSRFLGSPKTMVLERTEDIISRL